MSWIYARWDTEFCRKVKPSIKYLELFAVLTGVLLWIPRFRNKRIILWCDNQSVVDMINTSSSTSKNCMVLIRLLVLKGLTENVRIFAGHISGKSNYFSDSLSRMKIQLFKQLAKQHKSNSKRNPTRCPQTSGPWKKFGYHERWSATVEVKLFI